VSATSTAKIGEPELKQERMAASHTRTIPRHNMACCLAMGDACQVPWRRDARDNLPASERLEHRRNDSFPHPRDAPMPSGRLRD